MADPKDIKAACEDQFENWKGDCSGFLKAVAAEIGITITGNADDIVDAMSSTPWISLGNDAGQAVNYANLGYLVVAGWKHKPNGHVAIIVPGPSKPYPLGYWGQLGGSGSKNTTINWSFSHKVLTEVLYAAIKP